MTRLSPRALFNHLVVQRGREPPFWMLLGFLVALGGARLVVGLILKYGLEKRLFALVPGNDPNPMHVHHFNYGLVLIGAAGLAALAPFGRRGLRVLAFAFGVGAGLVFDEFGLIYNLNPEYAQRSSLIAGGDRGDRARAAHVLPAVLARAHAARVAVAPEPAMSPAAPLDPRAAALARAPLFSPAPTAGRRSRSWPPARRRGATRQARASSPSSSRVRTCSVVVSGEAEAFVDAGGAA